MFHHFWLLFWRYLTLFGLKTDYYFEVKLFFPIILLYIKVICVVFSSYVCNILIFCVQLFFIACLLQVCLCIKVMRLPYWGWIVPFLLKLFAYLNRIIRFFFCSLIYFFQNLVVHQVALTLGNHTVDIECRISSSLSFLFREILVRIIWFYQNKL